MNVFDRLTDYDVYAHVAQGAVALAAADYVFGTRFVLDADWTFADGFFVLIASYVVGHVVASPASAILERWFARAVLQPPARNLLAAKENTSALRFIFGDYYVRLDEPLRLSVLQKMGVTDVGAITGDRLFWAAYPAARADERASERMSRFLNLYGFCRNISFVAALTAVTLVVVHGFDLQSDHTKVALTAFLVATIMFLRFLKYYRLYSLEVLLSFSRS